MGRFSFRKVSEDTVTCWGREYPTRRYAVTDSLRDEPMIGFVESIVRSYISTNPSGTQNPRQKHPARLWRAVGQMGEFETRDEAAYALAIED